MGLAYRFLEKITYLKEAVYVCIKLLFLPGVRKTWN